MNLYLSLISGIVAAGIGGELFVGGAVGLARWLRVPAVIVGTTVAAFATSSPEFTVSVSAAMQGNPQIALGDALGSNVVNVGLILAVALLFSSIRVAPDTSRRDFATALSVPVATGVLLLDGLLSRLDGLLLLAGFAVWIGFMIRSVVQSRPVADPGCIHVDRRAVLLKCLAGLAFLVLGGRLIVSGARGIAASLGIDAFVVGATLVAIGTSTPELATTLVSRIRKHDEVGLGTILGSSIFNGLWIVGCAAVIAPIAVDGREVALGLGFGLVTTAVVYPSSRGLIERRRGALLLALYVCYITLMLQVR